MGNAYRFVKLLKNHLYPTYQLHAYMTNDKTAPQDGLRLTIDFTPSEYKIKYGKNAQGKDADSDLDYHLRVGNDPENLLRIYFLHDDSRQLIVVGSLPDHLRAVKVQ